MSFLLVTVKAAIGLSLGGQILFCTISRCSTEPSNQCQLGLELPNRLMAKHHQGSILLAFYNQWAVTWLGHR